ncbi:ferritin-like domain-containing protein [Halarcobacter ebronensis]|uniref:DUF2202 domain-containing protein n=1 Tax=Halarcobacter ebronensis TaxID=1462615 RepID=A0A4Q1AMA3_9BACT|nr:DUF2202 domain-containing protein [Halarcobacter ebronensis]QKF81289.1 ferritin-like protein (DUF2202 domain) [Halarcobacter ebronensis]RXK04854.1 DUF2202 domain-containing protein [Halarcobacter ebronensis]
MQKNSKTQTAIEELEVPTNLDAEILAQMRVDPNFDEPILHQVLRIAVYDEYHAYETYKKVIEKFGEITPFSNILEAEIRHYEELTTLLNKYQVPAPINDWEEKVDEPNSILEASEIAVAEEIDNIKMYDNLISYSKEYPDVLDTLYRLQAASYNNHLPALRQNVAKHLNVTAEKVDVNNIYQQYSNHNIEEALGKLDEFSVMASKFASGDVSQEDILKLLSNSNISFIGGALVGAVGATMFSQISKERKNSEEEE